MQLRADEAAVVEKAVRLAVESVMNVLCAVNSARTNELQRLVADREREIRRLEDRVRETEGELRLLRRWWSPSRAPEPSSGAEPDRESSAEQRECQVRVSLAMLTKPSSQDPPDGMELDQTSTSKDCSVSVPVPQPPHCPPEGHVQPLARSATERQVLESPLCPPEGQVQPPPLCTPEGQVQLPPLCPPEGQVQPSPLCSPEGQVQQEPNCSLDGAVPQESHCAINKQIKQEPHYPSPAQIKQEPFCPDYGMIQQEDIPAVFLQRELSEDVSHRVEDILGQCELWQTVSHEAPVPVPMSVAHSLPGMSRKSSICRREQSEEAMRRRRASWRAASRRYYARKMARLQTHTSSTGPGPSGSHYSPCSGPRGDMHLQLHRQSWGITPRGYSSCEQVLQHQPALQDFHRDLQDQPRPPHSS